MGISAVVVAVLSILASLLTIGLAAGVYLNFRAARDRVLRDAPLVMPVSAPDQHVALRTPLTPLIGTHGLNSYQRTAVVSAFSSMVAMSDGQSMQLDALLAQAGDEMFSAHDGASVLAEDVRRQIADRIGPLASSGDGQAFYFETSAGRAEIYSDRALFYRGSSPVILRASAGRRLNLSGHPILLPSDVEAIIALASESLGHALPGGQALTLRQLLSDPQQKLVSLNQAPGGPYVGLNDVTVRSDNYAVITFAGGPLLLDPQGAVVLQTATDGVPVASPAACAATALEGIFSIVLAAFLMIMGVRLAQSPHVPLRPVHRYSLLKTALAAAGGAAAGWMTASCLALPTFAGAMRRGSLSPESWGAIVGAGFALVGWSYPLVLEIAARSRQVRQHYALFE